MVVCIQMISTGHIKNLVRSTYALIYCLIMSQKNTTNTMYIIFN